VGSLACHRQIQPGGSHEGWHGFIPGCFRLHARQNTPIEARFTWGKVPVTGPVCRQGKSPMTATSRDPDQPPVPMAKAALQVHQDTSMTSRPVLWVDRRCTARGASRKIHHLFESLQRPFSKLGKAQCSRSAVDPKHDRHLHPHQEDGATVNRHLETVDFQHRRTCGLKIFVFGA